MAPADAGEGRKLRTKVLVAAVILIAAGVVVLLGVDLRALAGRGIGLLREGGPWAFFSAMAILPAVGVPLLTFVLTAGSAFGDRMGMGGVVAAGLAAITVNLTLAYWLARRELRPWLIRLVGRLGYRVPQVEAGDMTDLIVFVRVMPGVPFPIQNYLLGLAEAPPGKYFVISCLAAWANNTVLMVFGKALMDGRGELIVLSVSGIVALAAATHLVRRHLAGRAARLDPGAAKP
jgi:uncharacterized membrane protein YdjX (TVP38/TMEM64 family)